MCANSTPVLTPEGWTTQGELRAGDDVFSPLGRPLSVICSWGAGVASAVVTMTDGTSIKCHPSHEWTVYDRHYGTWRIIKTSDFLGQKLYSPARSNRGAKYNYMLPSVRPMVIPKSSGAKTMARREGISDVVITCVGEESTAIEVRSDEGIYLIGMSLHPTHDMRRM